MVVVVVIKVIGIYYSDELRIQTMNKKQVVYIVVMLMLMLDCLDKPLGSRTVFRYWRDLPIDPAALPSPAESPLLHPTTPNQPSYFILCSSPGGILVGGHHIYIQYKHDRERKKTLASGEFLILIRRNGPAREKKPTFCSGVVVRCDWQ